MLAWLSVWSEVQTCIWPSWCHCHSLSLASVKSRLVLSFWYRLTWGSPGKRAVKWGCVVLYYCVNFCWCLKSPWCQLWRAVGTVAVFQLPAWWPVCISVAACLSTLQVTWSAARDKVSIKMLPAAFSTCDLSAAVSGTYISILYTFPDLQCLKIIPVHLTRRYYD